MSPENAPDLFLGTFTSRIPLELPPNRGGNTPRVALTYSSRGDNGFVGVGWSLELGSIERSTKKGVDYDGDEYVLRNENGASELVNISGQYRQKFESDYRYVRQEASPDGAPYWLVTDRRGTVSRYGYTSASRQDYAEPYSVFKWCLDQVTDANGNSYTIDYYKHGGAIYPDVIRYNGTEVRFWRSYTNERPDAPVRYDLNFASTTAYRLKGVEIRTPSGTGAGQTQLARVYRLGYRRSGSTDRSVLQAIYQYGSDAREGLGLPFGGSKLHELRLDSSGALGSWSSAPQYALPATASTSDRGTLTIDLDGDARPDLVRAVSSDGAGFPYTGGAWVNTDAGWTPTDTYALPAPLWEYPSGDTVGHDTGTRFVELNGDGLPDLVRAFTDDASQTTHIGAWLNNGGAACTPVFPACAWTEAPEYAPPVAVARRDATAPAGWDNGVRFVDLDGDGRLDLLFAILAHGTRSSGAWLNRYGCAGTGCAWVRADGFALPHPAAFTGRDDSAPTGWDGGVRLVDVDADRKQELLLGFVNSGTVTSGAWRIGPSGWDPHLDYTPPTQFAGRDSVAPSGWDTGVRVLDVNGDGKPDLVQNWWNYGTHVSGAWVSTGTGWASTPQFVPPTSLAWRDDRRPAGWDTGVRILDVNSDGLLDIVKWLQLEIQVLIPASPPGVEHIIKDERGAWRNSGSTCSTLSCAWTSAPPYTPPVPLAKSSIFCLGVFCGTHSLDVSIRISDVNGDGSGDLVGTSGTWLNTGTVPDLLTAMSDWDSGFTTTIAYTPSSSYPNRRLPFTLYNVSRVTTIDRTSPPTTTVYSYSGAYYHPVEREFRGHHYVRVRGPGDEEEQQLETRHWYHQGNDTAPDTNDPSAPIGYMKGKLHRRESWDLTTSSYRRLLITYRNSDGPSFFTPPSRVDSSACEGDGDEESCGLTTRAEYEYDIRGNVTLVSDFGDVSDPRDDRTISRTYSSESDTFVAGLITSEATHAGTGSEIDVNGTEWITGVTYYYDEVPNASNDCSSTETDDAPTRGNLTRLVRWLKGGTHPEEWRTYDAFGNLTCVSDPDRRTTKYAYDSSSTFRTQVRNAKEHVVSTQYYGIDGVLAQNGLFGQPKSVTDANGVTTTYTYDVFGRVATIVLPPISNPAAGAPFPGLSLTNAYLYLNGRRRVETTASSGEWMSVTLDGPYRPTYTEKRGSGSASARVIAEERTYDASGRLASRSLPHLSGTLPPEHIGPEARTRFRYDAYNRIVEETRPDGARTLTCYRDFDGSSVSIDPNGHRRRTVRDARGNVVRVQEYRGTYGSCTTDEGQPYATTDYEYDRMGRLTQVTDATHTPFATDYDSLGRRVFVSDPDLGTWYYGYTLGGDTEWIQDANGAAAATPYKMHFEYDALHRMTRTVYPSGPDTEYGYDDPAVPYSNGRLTSMTDGGGTSTYGYDALGRVNLRVQTIDGATYRAGVAHDAAGRVELETYTAPGASEPRRVKYQYDNDGWLSKVELDGVTQATVTEYNVLGQIGRVDFGNGVRTTYTYHENGNNQLHQLRTVGPTGLLLDLTYGYDAALNVASVADGIDPLRTQMFAYDELNRLTSAESPALVPDPSLFYVYDPIRVHALVGTSDGRHYAYDANGNLVSDGTRLIQYDYTNRPTSISQGSVSVLFTYDGDGSRVTKEVRIGGAVARKNVYLGRSFTCVDGACAIHVFAGQMRIASVDAAGITRYYHGDRAGSTRVVTNESGTAVETIAYSPFGVESDIGSAKYRFNSSELDPETGLYYFGARYYNASLGRFMSPDPTVPGLMNPQALNRYAYVLNNPLRYTDPTGYSPNELSGFDLPDFTTDTCFSCGAPGSGVSLPELPEEDYSYLFDGPEYEAVVYGNREPYVATHIPEWVSLANDAVDVGAGTAALLAGDRLRLSTTDLRLYGTAQWPAPREGGKFVGTFRLAAPFEGVGWATMGIGTGLDFFEYYNGDKPGVEVLMNLGANAAAWRIGARFGGWWGLAFGAAYTGLGYVGHIETPAALSDPARAYVDLYRTAVPGPSQPFDIY
jgi:RHS repeat-associated protein